MVDHGVERVLDGMTEDWLAAIGVVSQVAPVRTARLGYLGMSMATRFGLPLGAALGERLCCAVMGKFGLEQSPVLHPGLRTSRRIMSEVPGRLVVRRIPDLNTGKNKTAGQETLFDTWRFHAFFTTVTDESMDTVTADKTHRGHAIIEQVNADLKNSALAHLPSGVFTANAAWLVCAVMAFKLTRAAATLTGNELAKALTSTIRRKLIKVAARIAASARRITLHLPRDWPWQRHWTALFDRACGPPATDTS
jgi:hypothetical protein